MLLNFNFSGLKAYDTGVKSPIVAFGAPVLAIFLFAISCISMIHAGSTGSLNETSSFVDTFGHWGSEYIENASQQGYVSGYEDGTFGPDNTITGAEIAVILSNAFYADDLAKQASGNTWYSRYVNVIEQNKISYRSYPEIDYTKPITRMEVACLVGGILLDLGYDCDIMTSINTAKYVSGLESYASYWSLIGITLDAGIMLSNGNFDPDGRLTRAQACVIIVNTVELLESNSSNSSVATTPSTSTSTTPSTSTTTSTKPSTSSLYPAVSEVGSYNIPADLNGDGWVTEEEVMEKLNQIRYTSGYMEGDSWDGTKYYKLNNYSPYVSIGYGCAAFAFEVSDLLFGDAPFKRYSAGTFDAARDWKAGDIMYNGRHWYIVIDSYQCEETKNDPILNSLPGTTAGLASGNGNGVVSWIWQKSNYEFTNEAVATGGYTIYTRYP